MKKEIAFIILCPFVCYGLWSIFSIASTSLLSEEQSCRSGKSVYHSTGSTGVRFSGDKIRTFGSPFGPLLASRNTSSDSALLSCRNWAVVTTIHNPTPSITTVSDLRKWCLVIVGDTVTPDQSYKALTANDNVFYLSTELQKELLRTGWPTETKISNGVRNKFMEMMPFKSFARKNIGYLFAIKHGAEIIYDFDDDNVLLPLDSGITIPSPHYFDSDVEFDEAITLKTIAFMKKENIYDRARGGEDRDFSSKLPFNPFSFMGPSLSDMWPRGFPIDQLEENFQVDAEQSEYEYRDLPLSSIGVIQSLCDGDPDTDAVFRMTRRSSTKVTFDRSSKAMPLLIPSNSYSPYNAQATTHLYKVFWGLYLPITVPGRVTDIWRSYICQRIMKDIGLYFVYTPPIVFHNRSVHDYLSDFAAEDALYQKTSKLLEYIDSWSSTSSSLPERILELWIGLYEHDYIGLDDVHAAREWLNSLIQIGYKFPYLVTEKSDKDFAVKVADRTKEQIPGTSSLLKSSLETNFKSSLMREAFSNLALFVSSFPGNLNLSETDRIGGFEELKETFIRTFQFFWPQDNVRIVAVLDNTIYDIDGTKNWISDFKSFFQEEIRDNVSVKINNLTNSTLYGSGWYIQQLIMMWADNFTDAEYIGFVDDDTVITSAVYPDDLFDERGRPRVIAQAASDGVKAWNEASKWAFKREPLIYAMTYFPVIVKRKHLQEMREFILSKHQEYKFFDSFFQALSHRNTNNDDLTPLSQFCLMMEYVFEFHRDEYSWHFETGKKVDPLLPEEVYDPFPKIAIHGSYLFQAVNKLRHANTIVGRKEAISSIMKEGYCYSLFPSWNNTNQNAARCGKYSIDTNVHVRGEWKFEQYGKYWLTNSTEIKLAHDKRRQRHIVEDSITPHIWNESDVFNLFSK